MEGASPGRVVAFVVGSIITLLVLIGISIALLAGIKAFSRAQARADARNKVSIRHIEIQKAQQEADIVHAEVKVTQAEREKRVVESKGIAEAQREIHATLTPLYIQHEAIEAQKDIATSGQNNTVIYVPAGTNGTPVITQSGKP